MTNEEAMYQTRLIINCLPDEEYNKIPRRVIRFLEENMEYNESIKIDANMPLEQQKVDDKAYFYLDEIVKIIENPKYESKVFKNKESNKELNKEKLLELLKHYEHEEVSRAKKVANEYRIVLEQKEKQVKELKQTNQELYESISKCPRILRKMLFRKIESKLLK